MMMRGVVLVFWIFVYLPAAYAAVGTWRNYTSKKDVRDVARSGDAVWAATSGGLFTWQTATGSYEQFTNAEGLRNIDLTAVAVDRDGNIWTGGSTGIIHVYTPATNSWRYIDNIATANQTNKRINRLVVHGDTVLICTEFGLSVFKIGAFEFGDTYTRFGNYPANIKVSVSSAAIHDGRIWATLSDNASTHRLASASLSNPNLLPPESWTLETVGTSSNRSRRIAFFNGRMVVAGSQGLFTFDGTSWQGIPALTGKNIVGMSAVTDRIAVCTDAREVFTVTGAFDVSPFGTILPFSSTSIVIGPTADPLIGARDGGVLSFAGGSWISNLPDGPPSNQFLSVTVARDGVVWVASAVQNGTGIFRFDGTGWKDFSLLNSPLPTNNYYRVSPGCDGSVWASSWGRGLVEFPAGVDSVSSSRIYGQNIGLIGIPQDTLFIVASNVVCDPRGNTWFSVFDAADRNVLIIRQPDGTWQRIQATLAGSLLRFLFDSPIDRSFAVDGFGSIWFAVRDAAFKGVVSLGNRGTITGTAAVHITAADGLPNDDVRTIVVDRDNDVWVGTERGIAIILDPSNPKRSGGIASYRPLNGLVINTIAVDPLNQKWVGTTEGVIVLSPDGTQQVAQYTVANTGGRLVDNDVKSIAVDPATGTIYFGTLNGLASLTTTGAAPKTQFESLTISPNPYVIPNAAPLTVDGLVANSSIKVLSIDGRLVRQLRTPGGRIGFWDGKNEEGSDVASGIYLIVAYSEDGSKITTGKVAVIRR